MSLKSATCKPLTIRNRLQEVESVKKDVILQYKESVNEHVISFAFPFDVCRFLSLKIYEEKTCLSSPGWRGEARRPAQARHVQEETLCAFLFTGFGQTEE